MKKHLPNSLRALFLSLAVLLSLPMLAAQDEIDGINYDLNGETLQATVIRKSSGEYSGKVVIPESVTHEGIAYSVTSIGYAAFYSCSGLTSVTIGNSVTSIGKEAFRGSSGLTSVTIGNSVTSIGNAAFYSCSGLTSVTIGNSVESIEDRAFDGCSGLTSVTIPNSVTSIGAGAFRKCSKLIDVYCYAKNVPSTVSDAFVGSSPEFATLHVPAGSIERYRTTEPWSGFKNIVAISTQINGIWYVLNAETTQATVIAKSSGKYSGDVVIPESVEHESTAYSVTSIGEEAFDGCSGLTSVTIPNSVTSIGEYAFASCSGLTSVTIPNSVTSIGGGAFEDCSGLTSIVVEEGNTFYDSRNNCNAIIETASNSLICGCNTSIIPNGVTSIVEYAFYACSGLTSVTIPNSVTSIGDCAFQSCSGLTSVTIGNGVESIGSNAFQYCSGLTSVTIGNGVESIGKFAFYHCPELLNVYCYAENVPSTDSYAFDSGLIKNATLHVPAGSVDSYTANAPWKDFGTIVALPPFSGEVEIDGINYELNGETLRAAVIAKTSDKYSGEVVIPESVEHEGNAYSVTSIGEEAFRDCSGLTSVTIPNSVTSIGSSAFNFCSGLTSVTIPNSVTSIGYQAFACSGLTSVTIGNSVESIGGAAFYDCSGLTSVTIPNSVTSIEYQAFCFCSGLTSVTIPNSVTSIGINAFAYCSGLISVTIGNSVESIGQLAFSNCSKLSDVYCYAEEVPTTESNAFSSSPIGTATLHVPAGSVDSYKTAPWNDFGTIVALTPFSGEIEIDGINYELISKAMQATVIKKNSGKYSGEIAIPETVEHNGTTYSVTSIGEDAFASCSGLTSVTIPNSTVNIRNYAFRYCSSLTSVTIPNSVTSIGGYAFEGCSGLTSVTIPNSLMSIGDCAFAHCTGLISVTIPNSVTSIGAAVFSGCSGLTSVTIPNSVTRIGNYAFASCSGLTSVTIPNSVMSIGICAFEKCSDLAEVTIGNGVKIIDTYAFYNCPELLDVYCYAEKLPNTEGDAFDVSYPEYATLHVPHRSIEDYKKVAPWSSFGTIKAISGTDLYFITYMLEGTEFHKDTLNVGATITPPQVSEKEGYTFDGWKNLPDTMPAKDIMAEGSYTANKYLLTFKIGDEVISTDSVAYGAKIEAPTAPEKEGHTFNGWADVPETMPANDVVVGGAYTVNKYLLTFKIGDDVIASDSVEYGANVETPKVAEKEGHTFNGWKDVPETMPANDVVVVGSYSANKYLLTFKIGDEVLSADSVEYGAKIVTPQAPEKEGHTFNGWENVPETMPANDVVIVGDYSVNKYLLTFKIGDEVITSDSIEYGAKVETPQAPEKEGHTFNGWENVPETMPAKDVVIVGSYSVNKYLLTFKIGDEVISADSVEYGAKIETPQAPEKEGHTFNGWNDIPETMPAKDIIISGSLLINTYKVTYMLNSQVFHTDSVKYGTKLPGAEVPVKEGHIFSGWMNVPEKMPAHDITIIGIFRLDSNNPQENGFLATSISDLRNNVAYTLSTPNHQRCEWPYKEVDYSLPRGKRVKIGTAQKELIPGKWYFLHNPRNPNQHASEFDQDGVIQYAGGFVTDQGIGSSLILSAKTIINDVSNSNGVLTDDYLPSMVRFVAVDSIEGAFNIQFGTGNWLALAEGDSGTRLQTITNDSHNAGLSGLYNFYLVTVNGEPNTAGRFGWNKYNMANRIDNNGGGHSVNFWSEGEIIAEELNSYIAEEGHASIKGNMIWQIYDIISLDEDYFDTDESDHGTPFSFVTPDSGNTYYMYHPVKKKFFNKNGLLTEEAVDPIYFEEGAYTWTLRAYFDDEHNINTNNEGEIVISDWKTADASNSFMFVVNNTFDTADLDNKLGIPHNYKITYMVDEEPYQVDTVLSGSKIIPIEEPTKEGHTFSGWQNVPDTMPIHDITIKGSFIINTYEVTFKIGDEVIASDSIEYGAKVETPQAPEKEGHTFNGWKNVPETMPANDVVVVGSYSVNKYLLTFKIGDEVIASDSVEYGAKVETPKAPEKEGHTFNGWKDVPETMPANDVVIVGDYSVNKYLLTFKIGDEVLSVDSVEYGANVETPKVAEKEGHTFNGWENVPETMPANDVVVVGSYSVNIYKVYYYVGDELVHTDEVAYGESIPAYEYTPTNGDKFMGWDGEQYDTMPAHDVTYIANIESGILYINGDMSEYQIYDLNGRKIENAKSLKSGVYIVNGKKTIVKAN